MNNLQESSKLYHFYHIYADGIWRDAVAEHLAAMRSSDLMSNLSMFFVGIVGLKHNRKAVRGLLDSEGVPYHVCAVAEDGWEHVTQNAIHDFSQWNDGAVLYAHTKGASDHTTRNINWRRTMTEHTVARWRDALDRLREYHAAGCYWIGELEYFFGGTFWWTKLEHLRELDKPNPRHRHGAEFWIGQIKNRKAFDLRSPGMPNPTRHAQQNLIIQDAGC